MAAPEEDQGGWKYYELPRSEFYEALGGVLSEFSDLLLEDPAGATKLDQDPYNDWFYCGYEGDQESFRVSLWPAYLPTVEAYEEGQISEEEFRSQCWPRSGTDPVTRYLGDADRVIDLAEDEQKVRVLADGLAGEAGIELVDDWDDAPPEPTPPSRNGSGPADE